MDLTPTKPYLIRAFYEWILDNDLTPHLMVDAEMEGVQVPVDFVSDGQIVLNISSSAVKTLDLGNEWIFFNARFGGVPQDIHVPMAAIKAIYAQENGKGMVFAEEENAPPPSSPSPTDKQKTETKKPTLRVVK
jgi:stringent starvation protein B